MNRVAILICTTSKVWFGLVSSFNGISTFVGYLMLKPSLKKNRSHVTWPTAREIRGHSFPKCISLKVNMIVRLEFELAYFEAVVQHFSHWTGGTPHIANKIVNMYGVCFCVWECTDGKNLSDKLTLSIFSEKESTIVQNIYLQLQKW